MTIQFYDAFAHYLGLGDIDLIADDIRVTLCDSSYTFDRTHADTSDLAGRIATSADDLQGKTWTEDDAGSYLGADPVTVPLVPSGHTVTQAIVYRNGATAGESYLIARIAGSGFPITTTGANVTITFLGGRVLAIAREGEGSAVFTEAQLRDVAASLTDDLAVNGQKITGVADPSADTDADTQGARNAAILSVAGELKTASAGVATSTALAASSKVQVLVDVFIKRGDGAVAGACYLVQGSTDGSSLTIDSEQRALGELPEGCVSGSGGTQIATISFGNTGRAMTVTATPATSTISSMKVRFRQITL